MKIIQQSMIFMEHIWAKVFGVINRQIIQLCLTNFDCNVEITKKDISCLWKFNQTMHDFQ